MPGGPLRDGAKSAGIDAARTAILHRRPLSVDGCQISDISGRSIVTDTDNLSNFTRAMTVHCQISDSLQSLWNGHPHITTQPLVDPLLDRQSAHSA
jgi:hypothetical protein